MKKNTEKKYNCGNCLSFQPINYIDKGYCKLFYENTKIKDEKTCHSSGMHCPFENEKEEIQAPMYLDEVLADNQLNLFENE